MVYSAKSDSAGTISQFTRRKDIRITTGGTSTPSNYQVKVTIAYEPEMQSDFQDIRFNTKTGVYIDYWIESKTASTTADVWMELPDAITDPGSDTIWMYYGNDGVSDGGVGADTFLQYHGTATAAFHDPDIITIPFIYEGRLKRVGATNGINFGVGISSVYSGGTNTIHILPASTLGLIFTTTKKDGTATSLNTAPVWNDNTYYLTKIVAASTTNVKFYVRDQTTLTQTHTTNIPTAPMGLICTVYDGAAAQAYSYIRKYIANEPTVSVGTVQHQRRHPQFI